MSDAPDSSVLAQRDGDHLWVLRVAKCLVFGDLESDEVPAPWVTLLDAGLPSEGGPVARGFCRVARALSRAASRGRANEAEWAFDDDYTIEDPDEPDSKAARKHLAASVKGLRAEYRNVIVQRYFEGASALDIARREGVPESDVRSHLKEALDQVRERMESDGAYWTFALPLLLPGLYRTAQEPLTMPSGKYIAVAVAVLLIIGLSAIPVDLGSSSAKPARPRRALQPDKIEVPEVEPAVAVSVTPHEPARHDEVALFGTVTDEAGLPVAGAQVLAYRLDGERVIDVTSPPPTVMLGLTDAAGRFAIEIADAVDRGLWVLASGYSPGLVRRAVVMTPSNVVLARAGKISGVVRDVRGEAISEALVEVSVVMEGLRLVRSQRTDGAGYFEVEDVPARTSLLAATRTPRRELSVQSSRHGSYHASHWTAPEAGSCATENIVIPDHVTVTGRAVWDASGGAVVGARVVAFALDEDTGLPGPGSRLLRGRKSRVIAETRTDSEGRFRLERVPRSGDVGGADSGFSTASPLAWVALFGAGASGEVRHVVSVSGVPYVELPEVRCVRSAELLGRVVDESGQPAQDAVVGFKIGDPALEELSRELLGTPTWTRTNRDGNYRLVVPFDLKDASREIPVQAHWSGTWTTARTQRRVTVAPGAEVTVEDLTLPARRPVRFRVVDENGDPVSGALLTLGESDCESLLEARSVRSDASGSAVIFTAPDSEGRYPEASAVEIQKVGYGGPKRVVVEWSRPSQSVEVTLLKGRRLTGTVDRRRNGAWPATVFIADGSLPMEFVFGEMLAEKGVPDRLPGGVYARVRSAADFGFVADDLPEGPYHVLAIDDREGRHVSAVLEAISADAPISISRGRRAGAEHHGVVFVALRDKDSGRPLSPLSGVLEVNGRQVRGKPCGLGCLRFDGVEPGTYAGRISTPSYPDVNIAGVEVRESPRVEAMAFDGVRRGRNLMRGRVVLPARGADSVDELVIRAFDDGAEYGVTLDSDGRFLVSGLAPETNYTWSVTRTSGSGSIERYVPQEDQETVRTGAVDQETVVTFTAVRGEEVVFEIMGADGLVLSPEEQAAASELLHEAALEVRCQYGQLVFLAGDLSRSPVRWVQRAGIYSAALVHPASAPWQEPYEVVAGASCRVRIPLRSR